MEGEDEAYEDEDAGQEGNLRWHPKLFINYICTHNVIEKAQIIQYDKINSQTRGGIVERKGAMLSDFLPHPKVRLPCFQYQANLGQTPSGNRPWGRPEGPG